MTGIQFYLVPFLIQIQSFNQFPKICFIFFYIHEKSKKMFGAHYQDQESTINARVFFQIRKESR